MPPRRAREGAPLLFFACTVALLVLVYFASGLWAGANNSLDWARASLSAVVPDVASRPAPLEAAWCPSATATDGGRNKSVAYGTGTVRSHGMRWRAAFDYCKNPPPCVLEGTTDAAASSISSRAAPRSDRPLPGSIFAGEAFEVLIHARDTSGNDRQCGGDSFQVQITGPSLYYGHPVDNLDGTHTLAAVLYDVGVYEVRARLDYRACVGLTRCNATETKTMVLEYVGEGPLVIRVVSAPQPLVDGPCVSSGSVGVPCSVLYGVNRSFDDPMYRRGRWQSDAIACSDADAGARALSKAPDSGAPTAPSVDDLHMRERCSEPFLRNNGWLWRPLQASVRPVFPLDALRGKWLHSIGDSLSRNLNNDISKILRRSSTSEHFCIYALPAAFNMHPQQGPTFTCPEAEDVPFLVRDYNCSNAAIVMARPPNKWTEEDSGKTFTATYRLLWMYEYFPSLDFRLTFQWMTSGTGIYNGHAAAVTFKSWAFEPFIRFVDMYKTGRFASAEQATSSVVPSDVLSEKVMVASETAAVSPPMVASAPSTVGMEHGSARQAETRRPAYPQMRIVGRALLNELFPHTTPSYVLVNAGLHHLPSLALDVWYDRYVYDLLGRLRADFPPPATRILWRSTAQTQWWTKTLHYYHMCRTSYRLSYLNERAANAIASFNEAAAVAGQPPIHVFDFLQLSLGRPDAAPDNRHYSMNVSGTVVDELFNFLKDCHIAG